jgi:PhzF family phenazine biosynthesis protein
MKIPFFHVDAFTNRLFQGNPAAVILLDENQPDDWMLKIAMEMNLSETAFLLPEGKGYRLRWFTPELEVDLCGHATLASAFVLFQQKLAVMDQPIHFLTRSGELTASCQEGWIVMDFPAFDEKDYPDQGWVEAVLKVQPRKVVQSGENVIVELESADQVRRLDPDFEQLKQVRIHGLAVTARSDLPEFDFISRYFAPWVGIDEDPVTGSAHACLGPYWHKRLDKTRMKAYQASRRGGLIGVEITACRVLLSGQAVMVFSGELMV